MLKNWQGFIRQNISKDDINELEKKYEELPTKKLIFLLIESEKALQHLISEKEIQDKIIKNLDIYKTIVLGGGVSLLIILPMILFK